MAVDGFSFVDEKIPVLRERLFARAAGGDLAMIERCFNNRDHMDAKDADGLALIHHAACHGNTLLIRKLREHGVDMNLLDSGSPAWKPIHYAIFHRKQEAEQLLRTLGAEVPLPILKHLALEKPRDLRHGKDASVFIR